MSTQATLRAGVPKQNPWLFHAAPALVGDPAVFIELPDGTTRLLVRDIELPRVKEQNLATETASPEDYTPKGGMPSSDREESTAAGAAELLVRAGVERVVLDRSTPMLYAHALRARGLEVDCDPSMGVLERRAKSDREVEALAKAQKETEAAVRFACEMIAGAEADAQGVLRSGGEPLTGERMQNEINVFLLKRGMGVSDSIVAGGDQAADCHNRGSGPLRTGETVIVDVFPMDPSTRYYGDCTRTVVHGDIPDEVARMHEAVVEAKAAAIAAARAGATADAVHKAAIGVIHDRGYDSGPTEGGALPTKPRMVHGTGHGVGLDVHEPPLVVDGGPELVAGDCLTIEPGLYAVGVGGIRVEDMVIVRDGGCDNLNTLPEGLSWA